MFNVQNESSYSLPSLEYNLQQIRISLEQVKLVSFSSSKRIVELNQQMDLLKSIHTTCSQGASLDEVSRESSVPSEGLSQNIEANKSIHDGKRLLGLVSMQFKRKIYCSHIFRENFRFSE